MAEVRRKKSAYFSEQRVDVRRKTIDCRYAALDPAFLRGLRPLHSGLPPTWGGQIPPPGNLVITAAQCHKRSWRSGFSLLPPTSNAALKPLTGTRLRS
jgi:hypothetical protein